MTPLVAWRLLRFRNDARSAQHDAWCMLPPVWLSWRLSWGSSPLKVIKMDPMNTNASWCHYKIPSHCPGLLASWKAETYWSSAVSQGEGRVPWQYLCFWWSRLPPPEMHTGKRSSVSEALPWGTDNKKGKVKEALRVGRWEMISVNNPNKGLRTFSGPPLCIKAVVEILRYEVYTTAVLGRCVQGWQRPAKMLPQAERTCEKSLRDLLEVGNMSLFKKGSEFQCWFCKCRLLQCLWEMFRIRLLDEKCRMASGRLEICQIDPWHSGSGTDRSWDESSLGSFILCWKETISSTQIENDTWGLAESLRAKQEAASSLPTWNRIPLS